MDSKLLTILNPQLSTKLDLQPTLATHHPLSLKNSKTVSNLSKNKIMQPLSLQITNMMTMTLIKPQTPPTSQMINLTQHQKRRTPPQKEMTLCFQECVESPPSVDPIHTAMIAINATTLSSNDKPVDKYLPEPQSFKAVQKLDDDVCNAWLHAIKMVIKNLNNQYKFILGKTSCKDELIIPVKLV
jgi:hypothetical protein